MKEGVQACGGHLRHRSDRTQPSKQREETGRRRANDKGRRDGKDANTTPTTHALSQIWRFDACAPRNQSSSSSALGVVGLRASRTGWRTEGPPGLAPVVCPCPPRPTCAGSCPIPRPGCWSWLGAWSGGAEGAGGAEEAEEADAGAEADEEEEVTVAHAREPPRFGSSSAYYQNTYHRYSPSPSRRRPLLRWWCRKRSRVELLGRRRTTLVSDRHCAGREPRGQCISTKVEVCGQWPGRLGNCHARAPADPLRVEAATSMVECMETKVGGIHACVYRWARCYEAKGGYWP